MFTTPLQRKLFFDKIERAIIKLGLPMVIVGLLIFFGGYLLKKGSLQIPKPPDEQKIVSYSAKQIHKAIVDGDYDTAIEQLNQGLKANPDDASLKGLYSQLMDEITIDFKFHYLPGQRRFVTAPLSGNLVLTKEDPYYLTAHASDYCYLYIFQLNSSGDLDQLFPGKDVPTPNPTPPGPLRIPDGVDWLYLDDIPGVEKIYLVASRWRNEVLEELTAKLKAERDPKMRKGLIAQILSRLNKEDQATDELPGLVFGKYQFTHEVGRMRS